MLVKRFQCDAGTFNIDTVMQGQSQLVWYDPLAQIALQPSLREETIMCYKDSGVEGMFAEIQSMIGQDKREVLTNPYYWTEYCEPTTLAITLTGNVAAGAAGAQVTVSLDKSDYSRGGKYSPPKLGYRGYIKELNGGPGSVVNITAVTKTTAGSHTIGLTPINGEILDLSGLQYYTLIMDTLRVYKKGDTNPITGTGFVKNPPALRKGFIQKFEDMIPLSEDELDGYAYDKEFKLFKGIDPVTGEKIQMWSLPEITKELLIRLKDNKIINSLWGRRDDVLRQGFDGLIPTADSQGMFSRRYDPGDGVSLKSMLFNMIKALRKVNGCTDYLLMHDFGFKFDWNDAMAALVKATEIGKNYQLFGLGGEGKRSLSWYDYTTFSAYGYMFTPKLIDTFDNRRYGAYQENFALMLPACTFKDTGGNDVAPVTFVNIKGSEVAWENKIWPYDFRNQGGRTLNVYAKTSYGMEIHCASKMGTIRKATC